MLSVIWSPAYNHFLNPNEAREKRLDMANALASAGFDAQITPGSSEVLVRRGGDSVR
jgi:hypothetical protein